MSESDRARVEDEIAHFLIDMKAKHKLSINQLAILIKSVVRTMKRFDGGSDA